VRARFFGLSAQRTTPKTADLANVKRSIVCRSPWLSRHLGHSSLAVTEGVYGHWSKEAAKAEIAELEAAFRT